MQQAQNMVSSRWRQVHLSTTSASVVSLTLGNHWQQCYWRPYWRLIETKCRHQFQNQAVYLPVVQLWNENQYICLFSSLFLCLCVFILFDPANNFCSCQLGRMTRGEFSSMLFLCTQLQVSFAYSGPRLWDDLPLDIRQFETLPVFRKGLKAHLFDLTYSPLLRWLLPWSPTDDYRSHTGLSF